MATSNGSHSRRPRAQTIHALTKAPLDLLIIGGGIVGSGIARDAAMRGLNVGLADQHDFAFGTSSRSSRLLHGGLRYLAQGRIGLVREASTEKRIIHQIAPHLAQPLRFVFPVYRRNKEWALWQLKIGVKIYDLLGKGRNLGKSAWLSKQEVLADVPILDEAGLGGGVGYYDAFTQDARLTIDTLRSAAKHGANLLNYCEFKDATRSEVWKCLLEDRLSGRALEVRARAVVNATGPWADGLPQSTVKLRLTKGIHLVVERARVPVPDAVVMTEGERILFAIPWGERTILGTTDTDYAGPLDKVTADADDIRYVLAVANQFFPRVQLTPNDVLTTWAGLRPLIADPGGRPSSVSRSHEIRNSHPGWWDVAGGKLTTYRLMAEQTVDRIVKSLHGADSPTPSLKPCRSAIEPLLSEDDGNGFSGIVPPEFTREAVEHYCAEEWAIHLDDVMVRRAGWHYYLSDAEQKAERVATWMATFHRWPDAVRAMEIDRYRDVTYSPSQPTPGLNPSGPPDAK